MPKRVVRNLYKRFHWATSVEKKWADMSHLERKAFAVAARKMCDAHTDIHMHAIVVKKENVEEHIRRDQNKLYNYMIYLSWIDRMAGYDEVIMIPDERSIRVKSGNSLHDYIQTQLWFTKKVKTKLYTSPTSSDRSLGVQYADMLAGLIQAQFEDGEAVLSGVVRPRLTLNRLFF